MRPSLLALSVVQLVIVSIVPQGECMCSLTACLIYRDPGLSLSLCPVTAHNEGDVQLIIMYNNSPTFEGVLQARYVHYY